MEKLLLDFLESAKKDRKKLTALKQMAVKCQSFEIFANLRKIEKENFTELDEIEEAKKDFLNQLIINVKFKLDVVSEAKLKHEKDSFEFAFMYGACTSFENIIYELQYQLENLK